ncbi:MAG: DNA-3-methyladenine glycosylase [Chitinophagaceae bacterium]
MKLPKSYFLQNDVIALSKDLLGKILCSNIEEKYTEAIIVETEAYNGIIDKASHAYNGRKTSRTETMYKEGGIAYIFLCYGMYSLFNIITNKKDIPHAILIRGAIPIKGIGTMLQRCRKQTMKDDLLIGPGKLSKAMGFHYTQTGTSLLQNIIWIEDRGYNLKNITSTPRIGIDYAGEDALLLYRFIGQL